MKTKKYKQTIIPEVSIGEWETLPVYHSRKKMFDHYRNHYVGRCVKNQHLGISVEFDIVGARKTSQGGSIYPKKKCLIEILDKMIEYAEYSNWGDRKENDPPHIIGYLNFNVKVKIDDSLEHIHLVVRVTNDGKFHYYMEVNKKAVKFT